MRLFAAFCGSFVPVVFFAAAAFVLEAAAYWRLFKKAGEPGWKSLIPVYHTYVQYGIAWEGKWFWGQLICMALCDWLTAYRGAALIIGILAAILGLIISFYANNKLSRAFGHGIVYALGLLLFSPVFVFILGSGRSQYLGKQE